MLLHINRQNIDFASIAKCNQMLVRLCRHDFAAVNNVATQVLSNTGGDVIRSTGTDKGIVCKNSKFLYN